MGVDIQRPGKGIRYFGAGVRAGLEAGGGFWGLELNFKSSKLAGL